MDILGGSDTPVPRHGMACHLLPGTKSIALLGGYNGHEMVSNVDILDLDVEAILARRKAEKEAAALANFGVSSGFCVCCYLSRKSFSVFTLLPSVSMDCLR